MSVLYHGCQAWLSPYLLKPEIKKVKACHICICISGFSIWVEKTLQGFQGTVSMMFLRKNLLFRTHGSQITKAARSKIIT